MENDKQAEPRGYPMIWAVRAVPVLMIFAAIDLLQRNPPVSFLVVTLVQLALGVVILVAIHRQRRDLLALSYVVVVFLTSLVHPVRAGQLLLLSTLALVVTGVDQLVQRHRGASSKETGSRRLDDATPSQPHPSEARPE